MVAVFEKSYPTHTTASLPGQRDAAIGWEIFCALVQLSGSEGNTSPGACPGCAVRHERVLLEDAAARCAAHLVINELDGGPVDLFSLILGLFHLEHVLVEVLLQLFVCEVDAKLLKIVDFELLESIDVQHTHHSCRVLYMPNGIVHLHPDAISYRSSAMNIQA